MKKIKVLLARFVLFIMKYYYLCLYKFNEFRASRLMTVLLPVPWRDRYIHKILIPQVVEQWFFTYGFG